MIRVICLLLMSVTMVRNAHSMVNNISEVAPVSPDSIMISMDEQSFRPVQLILPVTLVTVGSIGVCNSSFHRLNNQVRDNVAGMRKDRYFRIDDYIQYLPVVSYYGLEAVGVKGCHDIRERFMAGATAYLIMGIIVNTTKFTINEKRPHSNARNSFPSGHTATVFTGAELIRLEYGTAISIAAYAIATSVAFLRIYNDRHWLNDVMAGAGVGILSARIGYWMLPLYKKWFHWDKPASIIAMPNYDIQNRSIGIGLVASF